MKLGIACASGAGKNVFVHGFLAGLEAMNFRAEVYGASSSSAVPVAFAAAGRVASLGGTDFWFRSAQVMAESGGDVSTAVRSGVRDVMPLLSPSLFADDARRCIVAVSEVTGCDAALVTQGEGARRLGQQLLVATRKKDRSFADQNLALRLFDSRPGQTGVTLTPENLGDVLYATTRMLHAWREAAWIDGRPFIDASYTCMCPAVELAALGVDAVLAVSAESGPIYRDFFQTGVLPDKVGTVRIIPVQPEQSLSSLGVDYLKATDEGVRTAFELGRKTAARTLACL
jgi:hypothetical protein